MQAVVIDERGLPQWRFLPDPTPAAGEVVLRMRWSGLCGTDLFKLATGAASDGTVLGHEIVGEIVSMGTGVEDCAPGDRLAVPHHSPCGACLDCVSGAATQCATFRENLLQPGGFAEQILVRRRGLAETARRLPPALDDLDALFLEPAACVLRSLTRSPVLEPPRSSSNARGDESGRRVAAILGGGSMGLLHLLLLRAVDAAVRIVLVDPREDRRLKALELGADFAVPPGEALLASAREASLDGRGADAVFDCVGGSASAAAALAALRPGGTAVLFAHAGAGESAGFALNDLFQHEKRLVGTYSGSPAEQAVIWDLLCAGKLRPGRLVSHRLPLADFAAGVRLARTQQALKVAFHP